MFRGKGTIMTKPNDGLTDDNDDPARRGSDGTLSHLSPAGSSGLTRALLQRPAGVA
jgi:hypothetical protein